MPHLSGILHKVGDNPRDSDEAEKANADARDNEGEHGGKRSEAETGPRLHLFWWEFSILLGCIPTSALS